jgi:hypothetical protein
MSRRAVRLVQKVQLRMRTNGSARIADYATPREVAVLQARIRRLHALGDSFSHVTLSPEITQECVMGVRTRVGGEFVEKLKPGKPDVNIRYHGISKPPGQPRSSNLKAMKLLQLTA